MSSAHSQDDLDSDACALVLGHPRAIHATELEVRHELSHAIDDLVRPNRDRIPPAALPPHVIDHLFVVASGEIHLVYTNGRPAPGAYDVDGLGVGRGRPEGQD